MNHITSDLVSRQAGFHAGSNMPGNELCQALVTGALCCGREEVERRWNLGGTCQPMKHGQSCGRPVIFMDRPRKGGWRYVGQSSPLLETDVERAPDFVQPGDHYLLFVGHLYAPLQSCKCAGSPVFRAGQQGIATKSAVYPLGKRDATAATATSLPEARASQTNGSSSCID